MKLPKDRFTVAGMLAAALLGGAFAAWVLGGSTAHAQHAARPQGAADDFEAEIEDLERQMEDLQQMRGELRREVEEAGWDVDPELVEQQMMDLEQSMAELGRRGRELRTFHSIRSESRERLEHLGRALDQLQREQEAAPLHEELRKARLEHLKGAVQIVKKIAALEGTPDLSTALALRQQMEELDMKWNLVLAPKYEGAVRLSEMERAAAEKGDPPRLIEMIREARELHQEVVQSGQALYDLWVAHKRTQAKLEGLLEHFRRSLQEDVGRPGQGEYPPD